MVKTILTSLIIAGFFTSSTLVAQEAINTVEFGENGVVYLEDFEHYEVGTIPDEWYNRDGDNIPATYENTYKRDYKYKVMEENGNKFLRYEGTEAKHLNFPLIDKKEIDIYETPILKWDWRIFDIPEGGDEDSSSQNCAADSELWSSEPVKTILASGRHLSEILLRITKIFLVKLLPELQ